MSEQSRRRLVILLYRWPLKGGPWQLEERESFFQGTPAIAVVEAHPEDGSFHWAPLKGVFSTTMISGRVVEGLSLQLRERIIGVVGEEAKTAEREYNLPATAHMGFEGRVTTRTGEVVAGATAVVEVFHDVRKSLLAAAELTPDVQQLVDIVEMQAGRGLIEQVEGPPGLALGELAS